MKKLIIGFFLGLSITIFATVSVGDKITANLFNRLLDIKVVSGNNVFNAEINNIGDINKLNITDWIFRAGADSAGFYQLGFQNGLFSKPPICTCSVNTNNNVAGNDAYCNVGTASTTYTTINIQNAQSDATSQKINLICTRSEDDYIQAKSIRQLIEESGFIF